MAGCSGLGDFRNGLVLRGIDTVFEAAWASIEQPVKYLDLFGQQAVRAVCLPEPGFAEYPVDIQQSLFETA
ncbi:hypothetical protein D3C80_1948590 [compost metagenome]